MQNQFIDMRTLKKMVQLSETCIRRWIQIGIFPKNKAFRQGWDAEEIDTWLKEKAEPLKAQMRKRQGNYKAANKPT